MKPLYVLICLLCPLQCWAQAIIKEIKQEHPRHKGSYYSFPQVTISKQKFIANKINDDLTHNFLDIEPAKVKKSIFENIWGGGEGIGYTLSDIEYNIVLNSSNLLCLSISADGCSAYCEYFIQFYTYDLKSGIRLKLLDILTPEGQRFILDSMKAGRASEITQQLANIKDSLNTPTIITNWEQKEYYEQALELYESCIDHTYEPELAFMKFYITEKELHVIIDRCSAHANRNVDELDIFEFMFELGKIKNLLTKEFNAKL